MNKTILKKYAKLIVTSGVNVQKGQDVIIRAEMNQVDFVQLVVTECYKAGARKVDIDWNTPAKILKEQVKYESIETMSEMPTWQVEKLKYQVEKNPARIYLISDDPNSMKGIDQGKLAKAKMNKYPIIKPFNDQMDNMYQWTIVGVPSVEWAKVVFPNDSKKDALNKLWDAVLKTARVTNDPIKEWDIHNADLAKRCEYLNSIDTDYLEYHSSNGTNFKVWLMDKCLWLGGGETSLKGVYYNPNMPTEECFTSPIRGKAEGKVVATKPLSYQGEIIDKFYFIFKEGKVVECHAEVGDELLHQMVSMDDGASYLGECALVPFESPVNETGILFYETLFDENAVCHLALGRGFSDCVKEFEKYSAKEIEEMGINSSMIHVDFMIGSRDLNIDAHTRSGKVVPLFRNGTWAF